MPDISGIEVAKYFREKKNNQKTKIIAVTAAVMKDDIKKYYKAGINDFLIKPYKEVHLFHKICEVLHITKVKFPKPAAEIILKEEIHPRHYDLSELKKMTGNNKTLMLNMLNTFIENSNQALEKFDQALSSKNSKQIAETAHKILPSYRHLNVSSIINGLMELKNISQSSDDFGQITDSTKRIETNIQDLLHKLENEIKQLKV